MIKVIHALALVPAEVATPLSAEDVNTVLEQIASGARAEWVRLASNDPSRFRFDYIQGIQEVELFGGVAVISLVGALPHLLEDGSEQQDMREFLLGDNVPVAPFGQKGKRLAAATKTKPEGYYRAIPIRHMTPGTKENPRGRTLGLAMGSPYEGSVGNAAKLGKDVYKAAKKLKGTVGQPYGKTEWGGRLDTSALYEGGEIPLLLPHHKSDIYKGMYRFEKAYKKKTQSFYMTFRTISTRVEEGWIRKAYPARHFADQVAAYAATVAPAAFKAFVDAKLGQG